MKRATPCEACGAVCMYEDPDPHSDEPCYGAVTPVEHEQYEGRGYVDDMFQHACEGHRLSGRYTPENDAGE